MKKTNRSQFRGTRKTNGFGLISFEITEKPRATLAITSTRNVTTHKPEAASGARLKRDKLLRGFTLFPHLPPITIRDRREEARVNMSAQRRLIRISACHVLVFEKKIRFFDGT